MARASQPATQAVLVDPEQMPPLPRGLTTKEFYWVLADSRPRLAGSENPLSRGPDFWEELKATGVACVVCLNHVNCSPHAPSPRLAISLRDQYGWDSYTPSDFNAAGESRKYVRATEFIVERLRSNQGVMVHCGGGTGRTGTLVGCVLRCLGKEPKEIFDWYARLNARRKRDGCRFNWPESDWQASFVKTFGLGGECTP